MQFAVAAYWLRLALASGPGVLVFEIWCLGAGLSLDCYGAFTHTLRWDEMGWDGLGCADGNSMYFNEGAHALSYQRSPFHPIPACV